jgi:hypothetical protein
MLVGGYAVVYHGYNRTTGDLDVWVEQSKENFASLMSAFFEFGLPTTAIDENDFLQNEMDVYTFGVPPVCIEILTAVKGVKFEESFPHSTLVEIDGVKVNMIDVRDLIRNKKSVGRNKDLDDIDHLSGNQQ